MALRVKARDLDERLLKSGVLRNHLDGLNPDAATDPLSQRIFLTGWNANKDVAPQGSVDADEHIAVSAAQRNAHC